MSISLSLLLPEVQKSRQWQGKWKPVIELDPIETRQCHIYYFYFFQTSEAIWNVMESWFT